MDVFEFRRGAAGKQVRVEVCDNGLLVKLGRTPQSVDYADLEEIRWLHTVSPQRTDFGLILKTAGSKTVINSNSRAAMADQDVLAEAASAILMAVSRKRPELEVSVGASPAAAWGIFACYAVPAVLGLLFGLMVIGEPDAFLYGVVPLIVGGLSAIAAWGARPWRKPVRHSLTEFAKILVSPVSG